MTNPIARIERHDYRDPLGHPLVNDVDWLAVKGGNKALADRLSQPMTRSQFPGANEMIEALLAEREEIAATLSPQEVKARGEECNHQWQTTGGGSGARRSLSCMKCGRHRDHLPATTPQPQGDASGQMANHIEDILEMVVAQRDPNLSVYAGWIEGSGMRDSNPRRKAFKRGWEAAINAVTTQARNKQPGDQQ